MEPAKQKIDAGARKNGILASLPDKEWKSVQPHLEEVELNFGEVLCNPEQPIHNAYFMVSGVASLIVNLADGSSVEVASLGSESLVGAGGLVRLPREAHTTLVQAQGRAYKIRIEQLQRLFHLCRNCANPSCATFIFRPAPWRRRPPATACMKWSSAWRAGCSSCRT